MTPEKPSLPFGRQLPPRIGKYLRVHIRTHSSTLICECRNLVGGIQLLKTRLFSLLNRSTICDVEAIDIEATDIRSSTSRKQPDTCGYNWSASPKSLVSIHEKMISETGNYKYSAGVKLAKGRSGLSLGRGEGGVGTRGLGMMDERQ